MPRLIYHCYATSGSHLNYFDIYIDYSYTQSIANNTTTVNAQSGWICKISDPSTYVANANYKLSIGSNSKSIIWTQDLRNVKAGQEGQIIAHSAVIPHNDDGTFTPITLSVYSATGRVTFGTINASFSGITFPDIPRGPFVKHNGVWVRGIVYAKVDGVWKQGLAYAKNNGVWSVGK